VSSSTSLARRALPGAVVSAAVGVILIIAGVAQSSPARIAVGVLLVAGGVAVAMVTRRILAAAGERLFQVTVPPRQPPR
jgi:Zn-dependent membrane protease YugP